MLTKTIGVPKSLARLTMEPPSYLRIWKKASQDPLNSTENGMNDAITYEAVPPNSKAPRYDMIRHPMLSADVFAVVMAIIVAHLHRSTTFQVPR